MVRRVTLPAKPQNGSKLKGFVLMDLDTLIYGPINLRGPNVGVMDYDCLLGAFRNNLRQYLGAKTVAQRKWCVNLLIEECKERENSNDSASREFYVSLKTDLLGELKLI